MASMSHSSTLTGEPPSEVIASTMTKQPYRCATSTSVFASDRAPVEVAAWTKATNFVSGLAFSASSSFCGSTARPQSSCTITAMPPQRSTFSFMRPPNTPFWHTMTLSPGSTRLTKQVSIPAEPGAETGMVNSLAAWKANFSSTFISSISDTNSGSRWPSVGRDRALSTRGLTSEGPGPMSTRCGGWNDLMIIFFLCEFKMPPVRVSFCYRHRSAGGRQRSGIVDEYGMNFQFSVRRIFTGSDDVWFEAYLLLHCRPGVLKGTVYHECVGRTLCG